MDFDSVTIEKQLSDRLTIYDVAKVAGVGHTTVSRVINNSPLVKEATRIHVLEIMEQLKFTPSAMARATRTSRSMTIGYVYLSGLLKVQLGHDLFHSRIYDQICDSCSEAGYDLIYLSNRNLLNDKQNNTVLEAVQSNKIDGLIVINAKDNQLLTELANFQIPVLLVDPLEREVNFPWIISENEEGIAQAVEHLIQNNHKQIAFVGGTADGILPLGFMERFESYKKTLSKYNLPIQENWIQFEDIHTGTPGVNAGYLGMKKILQHNELPTAVIAGDDLLAFGVLQALYQAGIRVPEQMNVIGFDNILASQYTSPLLTTISSNMEKLGEEAVRLIIKMVESKQVLPAGCCLKVSTTFIERKTTSRRHL